MKSTVWASLLFALLFSLGCNQDIADSIAPEQQQDAFQTGAEPSNQFENQIAEVSCGQCQLGLDGIGCNLAVRIEGKSYYVDGSSIDDHGDAHGEDGLCNCIRQAKVSGEIKDGRFAATSIVVLEDAGSSK